MLSEMVSQVAAFLEDTVAAFVLTLEEQFYALRLFVLNLDSFMPLIGDSDETLGIPFFLVSE